MSTAVASQVKPASTLPARRYDQLFYPATGAIFLVLIAIGFQHYIFGGKHVDGSPIDPSVLAMVAAHGSSIFAWYVLFFVQSLLISTQNRRLHMKLGWSVLVIASMIALTGPLLAVRSQRLLAAYDIAIFDWPPRQFLLIPFTEIALYVVFVANGVLNRKRPRIHRPMMLLASLSLFTGATARISLLLGHSVFGFHTWNGFFGPVVSLGALLLLVRLAMTHRVDREFAAGYAAFVVVTVVASRLALTSVWVNLAGRILKL